MQDLCSTPDVLQKVPRPGRHGPPLYPAYLVGVNIWNNLVFGNLGRSCTNQPLKLKFLLTTPATFSSSSEWRLFYVMPTSRFSLVAFGSNLTARCVVSLTFFCLCNRKTMANMISFTDKKHFYLSFRTKGVETERKSWRGIGLDGSMAGKVVLLIKIEVVLWPFL